MSTHPTSFEVKFRVFTTGDVDELRKLVEEYIVNREGPLFADYCEADGDELREGRDDGYEGPFISHIEVVR